MYNFKLKISSFPKKTPKRKFIIMLRDVHNLGLHFLTLFQVTGKLVNYSDGDFPAEHEHQSHFFLSRPASPKFYVEM